MASGPRRPLGKAGKAMKNKSHGVICFRDSDLLFITGRQGGDLETFLSAASR
jgi:hypothetical protein